MIHHGGTETQRGEENHQVTKTPREDKKVRSGIVHSLFPLFRLLGVFVPWWLNPRLPRVSVSPLCRFRVHQLQEARTVAKPH